MSANRNLYRAAIAIALIAGFAGFTLFAVAAPEVSDVAVTEDGPVEMLTVLAYFACIAVMAFMDGGAFIRRHWYFAVLFGALALRELDFHVRFTSQGVFKTKFYVDPSSGILERALAVLVIALVVYVTVVAVRNHYRGFAAALLRVEPVQVAVLCGLALMAGSKAIDGMGRKLASVGLEAAASPISLHIFHVLEEAMELGIPVMFLIALAARASAGPARRQD